LQQEPEPGQPLEIGLGSGTLIQSLPREQLCWPNDPIPSHGIPSHPIPYHSSKQPSKQPSKQTVRNCVACVACFCVRCACPSAFAFSLPISTLSYLPCTPALASHAHAHLKRRLQYSSNLFSSVLQLFLAGGLLLPSTNLSHARHGRLAELAVNCPSAHDCEESGIKS
jgi:hypothetical protein